MRLTSQVPTRPEPLTPSSDGGEAVPPRLAYGTPTVYVIGASCDLLRGSGRHKYDDTGSRGFVVG
jgi:hypothetical protein